MTAVHPGSSWGTWRGRWIWDKAPEETHWWRQTKVEAHFVYLRKTFDLEAVPAEAIVRVTCDARYVLYLNGRLIGRGPVRSEPEQLGWDELDLGPTLVPGRNVLVALCGYYGAAGPWWIPAAPLGTLGRGSFCLETYPGSRLQLLSDDSRRPPAAPYMSPQRRELPQLTSTELVPECLQEGVAIRGAALDDPSASWETVRVDADGDRVASVWDVGRLTLGHVRLRLDDVPASAAGSAVDVVAGEDLRTDGLPETRPRNWAARLIPGEQAAQEISFFDPVGLRCLAVHHQPGPRVSLSVDEAIYPRPEGAAFDCDDGTYTALWHAGARTVDLCSTDAFIDCPGREQRAWIADSYVQMLVSYVTNPDWRLVRHHLLLTSRSRHPSGLLAAAAACDFARVGLTTPDYSLHWIRGLAAYWLHSGDEPFVTAMRPVAEAIIERYEQQRGASGLLEDFPGWVFLDWAQVDRDTITGAHDALYAAALGAYAQLPGAHRVADLVTGTRDAFEALWDPDRQVYVDAIGSGGRSRRISQHTNAPALLADLVPSDRVAELIHLVADPAASPLGGRLVTTLTPADVHGSADAARQILRFQFEAPPNFDVEHDVVAAQPWFCRFLHEAYARHDRREHILASLLRWQLHPGDGTLQEFWSAEPGRSSRCHGWSASPTYDLTSYVLGVRPLEPGYARAGVDPCLGTLSRASGRVPTPLGWLSVAVQDSQIELDVPDGMLVEVGGRDVGSGRHLVQLGDSIRA